MPIVEVPTVGGAIKEHFLVTGLADDYITARITHAESIGEDLGTLDAEAMYARCMLPKYDRYAVRVGQIGCRLAVAIDVDRAREITSMITFEPKDLLHFVHKAFFEALIHGSLASRSRLSI